ncbi:hypothetical protein GXM_01466 [Nostoc sphaeroides CCNUC1]|uniref:Uncharacterized protein n=1 Tax=Nostoc sphaeroides CCNUC1 TaxID=2653204 RepID=A0A5P8VUB5_9NOSO|nr:hypothetical protein GXM_01466 [Nostoc sphaeroides CCNUC1]
MTETAPSLNFASKMRKPVAEQTHLPSALTYWLEDLAA